MKEAPYSYILDLEVDPKKGSPYLKWLEEKHLAEVRSAPGFLWVRKTLLDERTKEGWLRLNITYGIQSREAFKAYQKSALFKSFASQIEPFQGTFRISRSFGKCDFVLD